MSLSLSHTSYRSTAVYTVKAKIITSVTFFVVGCAIFLLAYAGTRGNGPFSHVDSSFLGWFISHRQPTLTNIMQCITNMVSPVPFAVGILVGAAIWSWRKKEVLRPALLVGAMGMALVVSTLIKNIVSRGRPPAFNMISPLEVDYSFPSGHTIGIAVFLLVLGYLLYSRHPSSRLLASWTIAAIFGITLVAVSRLYLAYHWLTDVTASFGLACVILACVIIVDIYAPKLSAKAAPTKAA